MKHAAPIPGWDIRNGLAPALIIGSVSILLALTATLMQPPAYRAGIRILSTGGFSADEAQAAALSPGVLGAAARDPDVSGYNLAPGDFLSGAEVEQLLDGGVLRLTVRDADPDRAVLRVQSWAGALCADLGEDAGCVETGPAPAEGAEDYLFLKLLAAGLLGAMVGFCGSLLQDRWKAKENAGMKRKGTPKTKGAKAAQALIRKFRSGKARVGVIGLGYVGLPLVDVFGRAGYKVVGIDVDARKIELLNKGKSYIEDIPSSHVASLIRKGALQATTDFSAVETLDALSICVPTPLRKTGDPDLSFIVNVTEDLSKHLHPGMVIVLESTTYPGTTREMLLPKIEERGLTVGKDIFLAFSPERVDPGRRDWTTVNTPKVIGGVTPACLEAALAYYGRAIRKLVPVSSAEAAEMSKLLENTFRAVNIGLVNEVAIMCDHLDLDVWEVIEAAATKPFGFMKFTPGPGLGGHCIPIDPLYLSWKLRAVNYNARFIELASEINTSMPRYVVGKIQDALNRNRKAINGSRILVLGVAYKPNVSDLRESPALDVIGLLKRKGATVDYHDPHVPEVKHEAFQLRSVSDLDGALQQADCVVITTDHDAYQWKKILEHSRLVVDTRNALGAAGRGNPKVVSL